MSYVRYSQIRKGNSLDDQLSAASIATVESTAITQEEIQDGVISQVKRVLLGNTAGDWTLDFVTAGTRPLNTLTTDLADLENKKLLFRSFKIVDITVGAGNNYSILNFAGGEAPSEVIALDANTTSGSVTASLPGAPGTHSLNEVAGDTAIRPKNLVLVRDGTTGDPVLSSGREIMGLLQVESTTVNGDSFNDTTHQGQISFVRENSTFDDLEAVPVIDIENKVFNYAYTRRINFDAIPETATLSFAFADVTSPSGSTTLDNVIDNQGATPATQSTNIRVQITDGVSWQFEDPSGTSDILAVGAAGGGDTVTINAVVDVNNIGTADFSDGVRVDSGGTSINLGVTAGQIDSASSLEVTSTGGNLTLDGNGGELYFDDSRESTAVQWSSATRNFGTLTGGPFTSLMDALQYGITKGGVDYYFGEKEHAAGTINEGVNVPGLSFFDFTLTNLVFYHATPSNQNTIVMLNGIKLQNGQSGNLKDVRLGTTPASGDLIFDTVKIRNLDIISAMAWIE